LMIPFLLALFANVSVKDAFVSFFDPVVVLLLGGFTLAYALVKFNLDEEIAYFFVNKFGNTPSRFLLGIMIATAFVSFWMSNSATTAVMMPIAVTVLARSGLHHLKSNFGKATVLGVAYAATIGGFGTLVGTTPNAMAAKFLADEGIKLTFTGWMYYSLPFVIIFLPITWFILLKMYKPEIKKLVVKKREIKLDKNQKKVLYIFALTAVLWLTTFIHGVSEYLIALIPIFLFYFFSLFNVNDFGKIKWDILILIGGGLSLGTAIMTSGLGQIIAGVLQSVLFGSPYFLILFLIATFAAVMTIFASNTGTASFVLPIVIPLAAALNIDIKVLTLVAAMAVSLDFLVPVGTPPNAIAYSTRYIKMKDMVKSGTVIALVGIFLLSFLAWLYW